MQGGGVLKTQRDHNEQSLNYSQTNRHMYNNTDSAERGPVLTNEGSGFYSAQKQKDYYPKIVESKDLYNEHHIHFPINRKHNKGSSSLVGGNNNLSSRESSNGTGQAINQRMNIRPSYDSQVRNQFNQLPQISQARGTIFKNNYNKNNSSSNTNSGGAFVNTNSSLSPKQQMDQTNS